MVLFHISKKPKCRLKQKSTVIGLLLFICLTKESSKTFRFKGHRPFLDLSQLGCQFDFPPVVPICQLSPCPHALPRAQPVAAPLQTPSSTCSTTCSECSCTTTLYLLPHAPPRAQNVATPLHSPSSPRSTTC